MKVYAGVIVGGPLDSQRMARKETFFLVDKPQPPRLFKQEDIGKVPEKMTDGIVRYEWTIIQIGQRDEEDIAVWAPQGFTKADILKKLLARYQL